MADESIEVTTPDGWATRTSGGRGKAVCHREHVYLTVYDFAVSEMPVRWYMTSGKIYRDLAQGAARSMDEGKAAAMTAALEWEAEFAAFCAEQERRKAKQ